MPDPRAQRAAERLVTKPDGRGIPYTNPRQLARTTEIIESEYADLVRQRDRLREALRPFAEIGDALTKQDSGDNSVWTTIPDDAPVTWPHLIPEAGKYRAASAALAECEPTHA